MIFIYDRTPNDVNAAKKVVDDKLKKFEELTESDKNILNRGTLTTETLNRIESAERELYEAITEMGYYGSPIDTKEWSDGDLFFLGDFARIIKNAQIISDTFFALANSPRNIAAKYHYGNINNLERLLYDLNMNLNAAKSYIRECGTFECGE